MAEERVETPVCRKCGRKMQPLSDSMWFCCRTTTDAPEQHPEQRGIIEEYEALQEGEESDPV